MGYRNKTYVIFDGDKDMWAYAYMNGWRTREHIDFNFHDAHELRPLTDRASEDTIRSRLRERIGNTKQAIVLIGESTKNLYRFVRWELEMCMKHSIPLVAVNLNGQRVMDQVRCPAVIRNEYVVHVDFKMKIIQHALEQFPNEYFKRPLGETGNRHYSQETYQRLGL